MERMFVSIREAGEILGLGRTTVYSMINAGKLDAVKFGRRNLIRTSSIEKIAQNGWSAQQAKK